MAFGSQGQNQLEQAAIVRHLGNGRVGGESVQAFHQPVAWPFVDAFQPIHLDMQFAGEMVEDLVVVDGPVETSPELAPTKAPPVPASRLSAMLKESGAGASGPWGREYCPARIKAAAMPMASPFAFMIPSSADSHPSSPIGILEVTTRVTTAVAASGATPGEKTSPCPWLRQPSPRGRGVFGQWKTPRCPVIGGSRKDLG